MELYQIVVIVFLQIFGKSNQSNILTSIIINEWSKNYQKLLTKHGQELPPVYPPVAKFETYYDFIVIGAGSAGSVVANRLSEVPQWKVLLLEAGDQAPSATEIPAAAMIFTGTKNDWFYHTERQANTGFGFKNNRVRWPRGRTLGGSSTINYMVATRGHPDDYNKWAQSNPGWSWDEVLPYFLKSEDFLGDGGDFGYHKQGGFLTVEQVKTASTVAEVFRQSLLENGAESVDYNGKQMNGVSYLQGTLRNGRRCSTEKAFLRPAKNRKNLTIVPKAFVRKILIDSNNKTAYGVEIAYNRTIFNIFAAKEVIVSAGTVQSPQLLMLSGIGPKEDLQKFNITVIKDLPVGRKMYDHSMFLGLVFTANQTIIPDITALFTKRNLEDLVLNSGGALSRFGSFSESFSFHNFTTNHPKIEIVSTVLPPIKSILQDYLSINDQTYKALIAPLGKQRIFQINPIILHPKSYGRIQLKSSDPRDAPGIYPNHHHNAADDTTLLTGVRLIQRLIKMPSFAKYNVRLHEALQPGCTTFDYDTDDYWRCCVRALSTTALDPTTTCKMGPIQDRDAVVDPELKVYGIGGLRVIDASVIPVTISGHTNLPAIMVGEKGADLVKNAHGIYF